ncbi:PREDICTED: phytolongin Phyl2.2-like isoform X2 [Tarenaya hassleriana]|uniref:phytolongin Phyl2.2-like isoform X1 n=1 Tax=Tarenaya hassleriana TaxID=28532 RepID=UPI00053C5A7D|nr:PREDICTED: phytolongin Phyl2.2-like isoform X1 [Tarenaya hassleriana]XP_010537082.1 PREDICTED: phytolongin Phyl2.2-like isoform X2 [Tarenaya hassleriana]
MISNPSLLFYTCIAKGMVVLAEFSSEPGIEATALRCIENSPPNHSMFSHTVRKRTYAFSIDDPFVYFAIFDEDMEKSESLWLLNRLKSIMKDLMKSESVDSLDNLTSHCLQSKLDPVFAAIVGIDVDLDMDLLGSPKSVEMDSSRNTSIDSSKGRRAVRTPLLAKPLKVLKKKKRQQTGTNGEDETSKDSDRKLDFSGDGSSDVLSKDLRNGLLHDHHKQKAKRIWRKHVWMVVMFDLLICAILFGIWLWVCQGFQCIER